MFAKHFQQERQINNKGIKPGMVDSMQADGIVSNLLEIPSHLLGVDKHSLLLFIKGTKKKKLVVCY